MRFTDFTPYDIILLAQGLGVTVAGSDDEIRVAATPYGVAVTMAIQDLSHAAAELRVDIRRGQFTNTSNWFGQGVNTSDGQQMNFKGDHTLSSNHRISGRYSFVPGIRSASRCEPLRCDCDRGRVAVGWAL